MHQDFRSKVREMQTKLPIKSSNRPSSDRKTVRWKPLLLNFKSRFMQGHGAQMELFEKLLLALNAIWDLLWSIDSATRLNSKKRTWPEAGFLDRWPR